jgi:hypothetical protein
MLCLQLQKLGLAERLMDDAHARPEQHLALGHAREVAAQVAVRAEDDGLVLRNLREDALGRGTGDDDVTERFHFHRAVDVGERDMVGMLGAEGGELFGRAAVFQAATGVHVRQHDDLVGRQDLGGLRHEAHAAKGDHIGVGLGRLARQVEAVADEIGQVLQLGLLIVVRKNHGVALLAQPVDLRAEVQP